MPRSDPTYAKRLSDIQPFLVMELIAQAQALQAQGRDIVHMEVGEPDFPTPRPIVQAGQQALAAGQTKYTPALGIDPLREAIAGFYARRYGVNLDPQRVVVTPGASGAILLAASLLVDPGQGLLMTDPGYPCNRQFLRLLDGEGQLVPVGHEDNYQLTPSLLGQHWQPNTVGVLLATPSNPTGALLDKARLLALSETIRAKNAFLIVDEIYQGLCYDLDPCSILQVDDDAFVINSFSKYFGMTGWRLGWLVAPRPAVPELEKLAQNLFISPSTIAQYAALRAFDDDTIAILEQRRSDFARRRDFLLAGLRDLGFVLPAAPQGAFYLYAGMQHLGLDSFTFCKQTLEQHGVAVTPGADFGFYRASEHVRFAYTTGSERLEEGLRRLRAAWG